MDEIDWILTRRDSKIITIGPKNIYFNARLWREMRKLGDRFVIGFSSDKKYICFMPALEGRLIYGRQLVIGKLQREQLCTPELQGHYIVECKDGVYMAEISKCIERR